MRLLISTALLLASCSCGYLVDRASDFADQFRIVAGGTTGGGVRVGAVGALSTGIMFGVKPESFALGWKYGRAYAFGVETDFVLLDVDQASLYEVTSMIGLDYESGDYAMARTSYAVVPAALTWVDSTQRDGVEWLVPDDGIELLGDYYLWSAPGTPENRYAQVHAFDAEVELAFLGYLDVGYSPGELVDFLLGIFTIDIAADDGS